jgi:hypothetical protein
MSPTATDLNGISHLIALKISESETGAKGINSEDDEMVGEAT